MREAGREKVSDKETEKIRTYKLAKRDVRPMHPQDKSPTVGLDQQIDHHRQKRQPDKGWLNRG
jgi:hypothetical protein